MEGTEGREGGRQAGRRKAMEKNDGKGQKEGWMKHCPEYLIYFLNRSKN